MAHYRIGCVHSTSQNRSHNSRAEAVLHCTQYSISHRQVLAGFQRFAMCLYKRDIRKEEIGNGVLEGSETHWLIRSMSTVLRSNSSNQGKAAIPSRAGCMPASSYNQD